MTQKRQKGKSLELPFSRPRASEGVNESIL
jgi:hypothetical protein